MNKLFFLKLILKNADSISQNLLGPLTFRGVLFSSLILKKYQMDAGTQHTLSYHFLFMGALQLPSPEIAFHQVTNIHFEKNISFASFVLTEFFQENPCLVFRKKRFQYIQYIYELKKYLSKTKSMINPIISLDSSTFKYNTMLAFGAFPGFFPSIFFLLTSPLTSGAASIFHFNSV